MYAVDWTEAWKIYILQIHFCVVVYICRTCWVWLLCRFLYFHKLQCSCKALRLLISRWVYRAHILLIDVISYSNNDNVFSPLRNHIRATPLCLRLHIFSVSSTRDMCSCSLTIHQICAVDVETLPNTHTYTVYTVNWSKMEYKSNNFSTTKHSTLERTIQYECND